MSDNVVPFKQTRYADEESVVKPALKPLGMSSMKTIEHGSIKEGELALEHPERMLIVALSAEPTPDEVHRFWVFIERFRSIR